MSIFDPGKDIPDAPTWRCPHCRTLQPETSRCRACLRATVTCATCRHFRPTLVDGLGRCADDPSRAPLDSEEVHSCWVSATDVTWLGSELLDDLGPTLPGFPTAPAMLPPDGPVAPSSREPTGTTRAAGPGSDPTPPAAGLLEAPHVPPAGQLIPGLRRRPGRGLG